MKTSKNQLAPCFAEAASKADPKLVKAAIIWHAAPAITKINCYIKQKKFRDLTAKLIKAKLI